MAHDRSRNRYHNTGIISFGLFSLNCFRNCFVFLSIRVTSNMYSRVFRSSMKCKISLAKLWRSREPHAFDACSFLAEFYHSGSNRCILFLTLAFPQKQTVWFLKCHRIRARDPSMVSVPFTLLHCRIFTFFIVVAAQGCLNDEAGHWKQLDHPD